MKQRTKRSVFSGRVAGHWRSSVLTLSVAGCLIVTVVGQTSQSVQREAGMPLIPRANHSEVDRVVHKDPDNNWRLPANVADQLVQYPNADVAFICGPQLKAGSSLNPFPWFDATAIKRGRYHGEQAPRVPPFGPMTFDVPDKQWRNVIAGRVSLAMRGTVVTGNGTRFTHDFDTAGPAPGYSGHFRIRDASGVERIVKVRSVESDTSLTLANAWPFASVSDAVADTFYHELNFGTNVDHYYLSNYYDTALVQYINYYRTGDTRFLEYARKTADAWWHSQYIGDGAVTGGNNHLPPRSMAFAGLMLRALDGRPEMWDYLERDVRATFDNWVYRRKNNPTLYYDIREDGYPQLYAVMLAKVLPDTYPLYANGARKARTGTATDGAAKRATYLAQTEDTAVNFFGRLQWPDGSWRWDEDAGSNPAEQYRDIEQPFMVGLYLESVVLLHQLTRNARVKASLVSQLTRSVRHLYVDAFERNHGVPDLPQYRWRGMFYRWGGGTVANPTKLTPPAPRTTVSGDPEQVRAARHLNSTVHHAFGYAYYVTGDEAFKQMGDDVFEASYGDQVDGLHCLADSPKAKDYDMNYRASGRYLVWRLTNRHSSALALSLLPQPTTMRNPTVTPQPGTALRSSAPHTSTQLISNALLLARQLSGDLANKEQIEGLINQIENALRAFRALKIEKNQSAPPDGVVEELQAALGHARTAVAMVGSEPGGYESARLRLGWAAARLKRANERLQQK
jgi:hypothetical protein